MIKYGVANGPPVELSLSEELELTQIIRDIILEKEYRCLAYNICKDHAHMIIVCQIEELSDFVKIIKGKSSYLFSKEIEHPSKDFKLLEELRRPLRFQNFFRVNLNVWELASLDNRPGYIYYLNLWHLQNYKL